MYIIDNSRLTNYHISFYNVIDVVVGIFHRSCWGDEKKLMARAGGLKEYTVPVCKKVSHAVLTAGGRNYQNAYVSRIYKREMGSVGAPAVVLARAL